jgi:hypothetical protein
MKITSISPQFNCPVCKNHDRYYTNSSTFSWTLLRCNCGAEFTLSPVINPKLYNKQELISFNSSTYTIMSFYYKNTKFAIILQGKMKEAKINNNYYGDITNLFSKKNVNKIIADMDKNIVFQK